MQEVKRKGKSELGRLHPLSQILSEAVAIFSELGFAVASGPEIETEFYNFDGLNVPPDHPARTMQDTFWLSPAKEKLLLRTHTTAVDARYLAKRQPPFRIITPGRVFRNEATDATHETQFYQIDGLVVERELNLGQLKGLLEHFYRRLLGPEVKFRWRPSFFAFVEPGLELDIFWEGRWLEVVGAGLLHPNVFSAAGRDPRIWRGLAFGSTIDRLAMIKYGISDIRLLYSADLRFIRQF